MYWPVQTLCTLSSPCPGSTWRSRLVPCCMHHSTQSTGAVVGSLTAARAAPLPAVLPARLTSRSLGQHLLPISFREVNLSVHNTVRVSCPSTHLPEPHLLRVQSVSPVVQTPRATSSRPSVLAWFAPSPPHTSAFPFASPLAGSRSCCMNTCVFHTVT